jgi:putative transposase
MRYIELNPVRAGMVEYPRDYAWSSYLLNGEDMPDILVIPYSLYQKLGLGEERRREAYRALVKAPMEARMIDEIRESTNKSWAMGSGRFKQKIEHLTERRTRPLPKGRPRRIVEI